MKLTAVTLGRHFRVLVVGGGSGGMGASHKFARKLAKGAVAVIEPNEIHYYQPGFTLVGGGLMSLEANRRSQKELTHPNSEWIHQSVQKFQPEQNSVTLSDGETISYDYMIVATGMHPRFDKVKGLREALKGPGVATNYSPLYCEKTFKELENFESGTCLFTLPNTPIKCPGAPQKIAYIADEVLRKRGKRDQAKIIYATSLARLFGIPSYLRALEQVAKEKNVDVRTRHNLIEVDGNKKIATFEILNEDCKPTGETRQIEYSFLHVGPPCAAIEPLQSCQPLADANGFVDVNPETLQSKAFPNVFGVGDCMNSPNAKTAAAVSSHLKTVERNLGQLLDGKQPDKKYDGYASCPLVVGTSKAILAEFNSKGSMETTPMDQSKPRYSAYLMKRYLMPFLYWHGLVKGYWNGPATIRKILHLGFTPRK